ncbi:aminodeoxychorismate synthase component I [Roseibium sp. TrichSKD4]|uniref:aminodeoxychorismate synthase component I n=1 Tax=Roseibium sp. TrichSKD4 TaxID=744980 RepID=UPI001AD909CC|nr:aminodeoxychorismate synthase component I [Roseibium sp. TrichSKD4]
MNAKSMPANQLAPGTVLLVDALKDRAARLFQSPLDVITCNDLTRVSEALQAVERARKSGKHVAGYLTYELGYAFEEKLAGRWKNTGEPLLWFGVYEGPVSLSLKETRELLSGTEPRESGKVSVSGFDMDKREYEDSFREVQNNLAKGDIYQVNLTMRAGLQHEGAPEHLFSDLLSRQPVAHAALVKTVDRSILSVSPELFLERRANTLRTRPMKGTAGRGRTIAEDRSITANLARDPKQRAENTMIVDLMRNDLSRICRAGSVKVTSLCDVERYRTVHQMTSTIEGELEADVQFPKIIEHLFPCGSITGAPKLSAMMIADRLETSPRGVYTGSIGAMEPNGDFAFNVAIRTLDLKSNGTGVAGTGSGVVFDSGAGPEYDECALKLKFLSSDLPGVGLIETFAYLPEEGFLLLERHLNRLARSAKYLGFVFEEERLRGELFKEVKSSSGALRVRLEMAEDGTASIQAMPLVTASDDTVWKLCLADEPVDSGNAYLFHKTTHRAFYDETRTRMAAELSAQEVLFVNENGFLTEGSFTTLFVKKNGKLLTPALEHGLLPGILREALLDKRLAYEADLRPEDLITAEALFVGNSVRGLIRSELMAVSALKQAS